MGNKSLPVWVFMRLVTIAACEEETVRAGAGRRHRAWPPVAVTLLLPIATPDLRGYLQQDKGTEGRHQVY
jgi:hypothetical protein